jgi:hypothetical protein
VAPVSIHALAGYDDTGRIIIILHDVLARTNLLSESVLHVQYVATVRRTKGIAMVVRENTFTSTVL